MNFYFYVQPHSTSTITVVIICSLFLLQGFTFLKANEKRIRKTEKYDVESKRFKEAKKPTRS